jgi:hypothetical protein
MGESMQFGKKRGKTKDLSNLDEKIFARAFRDVEGYHSYH